MIRPGSPTDHGRGSPPVAFEATTRDRTRNDDEVHVGETSWAFLLVGTFAAVGAAMAFGTLAALVRYHRTGAFPGSDEAAEPSTRKLALLWSRVAVGVVLAGIGIVAIDRAWIL